MEGVPPETMKMQPQIPPLRFAPVGMTAWRGNSEVVATNFQGRSFDSVWRKHAKLRSG
jgi:hypothetical protein